MTKNYKRITNMKIIFINLIFIFTVTAITAQISEDILPYTYNNRLLKSTNALPSYKVKAVNITEINNEDDEFPTPYRYAIFEDVDLNIKQVGINTKMTEAGGGLWRYTIEAENFKSIQLQFKKYKLPEGARLFIYTEDYSTILGAFTANNNNTNNNLMIAPLIANKAVIEYFEPFSTSFKGELTIGSIGKGYKEIYSSLFSTDEDGYVGINCPEGEDWQNEKHAVCLITFRIGASGYTCSGTFLNNTRNDGTPYFLTAHHCISEPEGAETAIAYFNYERVGCNGLLLNKSKSISGANLKSMGDESDYSLILFDEDPPVEYQPYFAGWDASNQSVASSVGIHHPNGLPKKICIDFDAPVTYNQSISWDNNIVTPKNTHWEVGFEIGKTYSGSSGSALFDNNKRVIGQLHGGDDVNEYYGKLSYSWLNNNSGFLSLKYYLDPDNSGVKILDAYYPSGNLPDPQFYPEFSTACKSAPVQFTGFSAFEPIAWLWEISPSSVSFVQGTTATDQNPVIEFNENGIYGITLTATNSAGKKSNYMYNVITVDTTLELEIMPYALKDSCVCNFDSLVLEARGADKYTWRFKNELENTFLIVDDTTSPVIIKSASSEIPLSKANIDLLLVGTHGSCSTETDYSFSLIQQDNDFIADATQVFLGQNGLYSNRCASVEENEPIPPFTSCTGQFSWCDEYGTGDDIVEHSVWFYFIPDKNDFYEISSKGLDNQIAVYLADSYTDVLNDNYYLIGANDDYNDYNSDPVLENLELVADSIYWIQVDGSSGGEEGDFYLYISKVSVMNKTTEKFSDKLKIYPQPADDLIHIEFNPLEAKNARVIEIYNTSGKLVYSGYFSGIKNSIINVDISDLINGMYVVRLICDEKVFSGQFIK